MEDPEVFGLACVDLEAAKTIGPIGSGICAGWFIDCSLVERPVYMFHHESTISIVILLKPTMELVVLTLGLSMFIQGRW